MKVAGSLVLVLLVFLVAIHIAQCAKRIDVKKRMAQGMAKRELQRRSSSDDRQIVAKKETSKNEDLLHNAPNMRRVRSQRVNIPHKSAKLKQGKGKSVREVEKALGLQRGERLKRADAVETPRGKTKEKLIETYKGLPVIGEGVVVETDEDGEITGEIHGNLIEGIEEDVPSIEPILDATGALEIAVSNEVDDMSDVVFDEDEDAELVIYVLDSSAEDVKAFLAWKLSYRVEKYGRVSRPFYIIEAVTAPHRVLKHWQGINMAAWRMRRNAMMKEQSEEDTRVKRDISFAAMGVGGNAKAGIKFYGKGTPALDVTRRGDRCYLENTKIKILHMNYSWEERGDELQREAHSFECDTGDIDLVNEAYSPVNDAFYFANVVYDLYWDYYWTLPLSGKIIARVHYGEGFENAFWDGRYMTFGDGNNTFYPLVTMDIMGHELGHGFTEQHSGLIYNGQSGGINEAFSDIAGETSKAFGLRYNDWLVGYYAFKEEDKSLRYFEDPTRDNHSIGHASDYCPGIDVHHSSGVFNRAFYLLANTEGWDIFDAFAVFMFANRLYWTPSSNYVDGACGVKQIAWDWGYNEQDVVNAFNEVGIEPCEGILGGGAITYELSALEGQTKTFSVHVPDVDYVRFETWVNSMYLWWYYNETIAPENLDLIVTNENSGQRYESTGETSKEIIEVTEDVMGDYTVELHAALNFSQVTLYSIVDEEILDHNLYVPQWPTVQNMTFEVPEDIGDMSVAVRVTSPANFSAYAVVRYEEPVDMENWIADYWGDWLYYEENEPTIVQILICKPLPGTYYMSVMARNETKVSVDYMHLLSAQNAD